MSPSRSPFKGWYVMPCNNAGNTSLPLVIGARGSFISRRVEIEQIVTEDMKIKRGVVQ
jgi:hypothetical protein